MHAKQSQQNHVSLVTSVTQNHAPISHVMAIPSAPIPPPPTQHVALSNSPFQTQIQPQLTPEEVEHQLRMMRLTQLQHHQAQRQEQQQQPLYHSILHQRQHLLRTPEHDRHHTFQQPQVQRSFPSTPEPQFAIRTPPPQMAQGYVSQQQQNQLHMQQQLLIQLSQAGVMPDQIHLLDPVQREAIMNEAMRKIVAAERLDQRNRRRLMKMERMVKPLFCLRQPFLTRIFRPDTMIS